MRPYPLLVAILATVSAAAPARSQVTPGEFAARRDSVGAIMGRGAVIAFGVRNSVGHISDFRQLPDFEYLTGFHEPDAVLVMLGDQGRVRPTLFTATPTVRTQFYDGFREDPAALAQRTGFRVRPMGELDGHVDSLVAAGVPLFELRDFESDDYAAQDSLTRGGAFVKRLVARHPELEVRDLHPELMRLRSKKSEAEAALLRRAVAVTAEAHRVALGAVRPGAGEYEVQAAIEHTFRRNAARPGFSTIVGSGPNSTTLHYSRNGRVMRAGEVVVMDIGAEVEGYTGDLTRTLPVSGRFSPEQREIYALVLASEKAAERAVRPGAPAAASLQASVMTRLEGLTRLGLIQSPEATYDPPWPVDCEAQPSQCLQGMLFMIHGISHGIGLEVHDPAQFYSGERTFQPGDVFTIEPGIYVSARALGLLGDTPKNRAFIEAVGDAVRRYDTIGVRIEDNYLVTDTGVERLSVDAPREIAEIEAGMGAGDGAGH